MIEEPIHQEDITTLNVYVTNSLDEKYTKQNLIKIKREIYKLTIAGDSKISLSTIDRTTTQRSKKDIVRYRTSLTKRI